MTDKNGIQFDNGMAEAPDTDAWSQLTFTCPQCGSHKLLKCLGGQLVYGLVDDIHYKREEWEENDEEGPEAECDEQDAGGDDDVDDAYVVVQSRSDGSEIWEFGVDNASDHSSWFRCADCDYALAFKDGSPVEEDTELAQWLIRWGKESPSNS
jgi:hypothetical protein